MINKIRHFFTVLTLPEALALGLAIILLIALVGWGGHAVSSSYSQRKFEKERAVRLKSTQDALALAEKATKSAEVKEAKADLLAQQNGVKAQDARTNTVRITEEERVKENEISIKYTTDRAYIDSALSDCDRANDICARQGRLGLGTCDQSAVEAICTGQQP